MARLPKLLLSGLALGLAVVIAAEVHLLGRTEDGAETGSAAAVTAEARAQGGHGDSATIMQQILARPLFAADRKPPPPPVAPIEETGGAPVAAEFDQRLAGVVITAEGRSALFVSPSDNKSTEVELGGEVDGWTVEEIERESVKITSDQGEKTVPLWVPNGDGIVPPPVPRPAKRYKAPRVVPGTVPGVPGQVARPAQKTSAQQRVFGVPQPGLAGVPPFAYQAAPPSGFPGQQVPGRPIRAGAGRLGQPAQNGGVPIDPATDRPVGAD